VRSSRSTPGKRRYGLYRSRAEVAIAEFLKEQKIDHIYEKPTAVIDDGKTKIWYPDFALKGGILIEYFGVRGNSEYYIRSAHKRRVYRANQFTLISLYPTDYKRAGWKQKLLKRIHQIHQRSTNQINRILNQ